MIEIIKHGDKIYTQKCKECGCIFNYQIEDRFVRSIKVEHFFDKFSPDEQDLQLTIECVYCPDCETMIEVKRYLH